MKRRQRGIREGLGGVTVGWEVSGERMSSNGEKRRLDRGLGKCREMETAGECC